MYLMYTLNENGDRIYTLKVCTKQKLQVFRRNFEICNCA